MASYLIKDNSGVIWSPTILIRWPNVFEAKLPKGADPGKTPMFSAVGILSGNEPDHEEYRSILWEEMDRACVDKHGVTINEMRQRGKFKLAVKRNNDPEAGKQAMAGFKERPDGLFFSASSQFQPPVMDPNQMGMSKDRSSEVYDGMFGQIGVTAWAWSHPVGGKGVSLNLHGMIKRLDGNRLGGVSADMASQGAGDGYVPEGAMTPDQAAAAAQEQGAPPADQQQQQPASGGGESYGF